LRGRAIGKRDPFLARIVTVGVVRSIVPPVEGLDPVTNPFDALHDIVGSRGLGRAVVGAAVTIRQLRGNSGALPRREIVQVPKFFLDRSLNVYPNFLLSE
jgi:hypothetical protein